MEYFIIGSMKNFNSIKHYAREIRKQGIRCITHVLVAEILEFLYMKRLR